MKLQNEPEKLNCEEAAAVSTRSAINNYDLLGQWRLCRNRCLRFLPLSHAALRVFVAVFRPVRRFFRDAAAVFLALGAALAEDSNSSLGCFEGRWWP